MAYTEIGPIKSSSSKYKTYALSVNELGELGCSCPSWINAYAPKTCKHTKSREAGRMRSEYLAKLQPSLARSPSISPSIRMLSEGYFVEGRANQRLAVIYTSDLQQIEIALRAAREYIRNPYATYTFNTMDKEVARLGF